MGWFRSNVPLPEPVDQSTETPWQRTMPDVAERQERRRAQHPCCENGECITIGNYEYPLS